MKCPRGCEEKLEYSTDMFIGPQETWHGELDMKSLGTGINEPRCEKPVFGLSDPIRHKPGCTTTQDG